MPITNVIQRGNACHVYNEKNSNIFTIPGELMGYTSTTVNVKRQHSIYTYNEKNQQIACRPAQNKILLTLIPRRPTVLFLKVGEVLFFIVLKFFQSIYKVGNMVKGYIYTMSL